MISLRRRAPSNGRLHSTAVLRGGEQIGRVRYARDEHHLVVHELRLDAAIDVGPVLNHLLAAWPDQTPSRLTHYGVDSVEALRWYRSSHLAAGLVLNGTIAERPVIQQFVRCVDITSGEIALTAVFDTELRAIGSVEAPDLRTVHSWFNVPNPLLRIAAVRRLGFDLSLEEELVQRAHLLALVNDASGVRQLACVQLSGFSPRPTLRADPARLLGLLADPLRIPTSLGLTHPPPPGWHPHRARRDARYAVAWILANLVRALGQEPGTAWRAEALTIAGSTLGGAADRLTPARDAFLARLVLQEHEPSEEERGAFGTEEPVDLLDWLRFSVLRGRLIEDLGLTSTDAFAWLARDARLLTDHLDVPGLAAAVYAPSPPIDLQPRPTRLPPWLYRAEAPPG